MFWTDFTEVWGHNFNKNYTHDSNAIILIWILTLRIFQPVSQTNTWADWQFSEAKIIPAFACLLGEAWDSGAQTGLCPCPHGFAHFLRLPGPLQPSGRWDALECAGRSAFEYTGMLPIPCCFPCALLHDLATEFWANPIPLWHPHWSRGAGGGLSCGAINRGTPSPSSVSPFWTPKEGRMAPQACPGGMENPTCGWTESRISISTASVPNHRASFGSLVSTTCSFNFVEHNSLYIH